MAEQLPHRASGYVGKTEIEQLWQEHSGNPERQAEACATLCQNHAPYLAAWLYLKIVRSIPDTTLKKLLFSQSDDPRMKALTSLALLKENGGRPAVPKPQPTPFSFQQPALKTPAVKLTDEAMYAKLFGVHPAIVETKPLQTDPELGRYTIKDGSAAEFRLWIIARDITRQDKGSGVITKKGLWERVKVYRIRYTRRHYNRLLAAGNGLFWHIVGEKLYLCGYLKVACEYVRKYPVEEEATSGNLPGVRAVYLDVSGSLAQWEGMLYAGWIAARGYKHDITISRETLAALFGRTPNTLRKWEKERLNGVLTKRENVAQCADYDRYAIHIPVHAQSYVARVSFKGQIVETVRLYWQLPNTYHANIQSHARRGQSAKVRRAVNAENPAVKTRGGQVLRYLPSPDALKRRYRSFKFRMGKLGDTNRPVYVYVGDHRRSRRGVFEITNTGFVFTQPNEREKPADERRYVASHLPTHAERTIRYWREEARGLGIKNPKLGHFLEAHIAF